MCCAGVDLDAGRWVRMYPTTFRRLADKRLAKYQVITCEVGLEGQGINVERRPRGEFMLAFVRHGDHKLREGGAPPLRRL